MQRLSTLAATDVDSYSLKADGTVWAVGDDEQGELGDGNYTTDGGAAFRSTPAPIEGLSSVKSIAAGWGGYALREDGTVWWWGCDFWGAPFAPAPTQIAGLGPAIAITGGGGDILILQSDGTVWARGDNSTYILGTDDPMGDPTKQWSTIPLQIQGIDHVVALAATAHALALRSDGSVWAWGDGTSGELGNGSFGYSSSPVQVVGIAGVVSIAAGGTTSYAITADGSLWAWGTQNIYSLGDGSTDVSAVPIQILGVPKPTAIATAYGAVAALAADGSVWAWGDNGDQELGSSTLQSSPTPIRVNGVSEIVEIAGGYGDFLARAADGSVWAWGSGVLGDGTTYPTATPVHSLLP